MGFILFLSSTFSAQEEADTLVLDSIHSPKKATLFSAIIPGSGQIYNNFYRPKGTHSNLWWKLPIIYGGLGASVYYAMEYNKIFKAFFNERKNRLNPDYTPQLYPQFTSEQLYPEQERFRKYRDYSIIAGLLVYTLNIIDANVEGNLLHFDISDDLSLQVRPKVFSLQSRQSIAGVGVTVSIR